VNSWAVINSLKTVWLSNHSGECSIKSEYQVTAGTLAVSAPSAAPWGVFPLYYLFRWFDFDIKSLFKCTVFVYTLNFGRHCLRRVSNDNMGSMSQPRASTVDTYHCTISFLSVVAMADVFIFEW